MHIRTLLPCCITFIALQAAAQQVTIIESGTGNSWAVQDSIWYDLATGMGLSSSVVPQSTLDDLGNLSGTDVLIVSSATISYTGTDHLQTIVDYMLSGRPAYIQSEYQTYYQGNITFDSLMQAAGADFHWTSTVSGNLIPMNVTGDMALTPNVVPSIDYYNYGCAGAGNGVSTFLEFNGQHFGFIYDDPLGTNGCVITQSDEDWVWNSTSPALMGNMLQRLVNCGSSSVNDLANTPAVLMPGLFSGDLIISSHLNDRLHLCLYDANGRMVLSNAFSGATALNTAGLPAGLYLYVVLGSNGIVQNGKVVKE